jgi:hypothetical protein
MDDFREDAESPDGLLDLLERIRKIAAMDDRLALEQLDELLVEFQFGGDWQRHNAREAISRVRTETEVFANALQHKVQPERWWEGRDFKRRVDNLGKNWLPDVREQFAGDIAEVKLAAEPVARAAAVFGVVSLIEADLVEGMASTQVADRILRDMQSCEEALQELGGLDEHAALLRRARERAVRYRWQKRVDEAEVVEAGGNERKAVKLRAEAKVMLKQDWLRAFPSEPPPDQ